MRCSRVKAQLTRYIDSELGEARARELAAHISSCEACSVEEASLRATLGLLTEWPEAEPRLGFNALLERIGSGAAVPQRRGWAPDFPVPKWAVAGLAAASIAAGGLLGTMTPASVPTAQPVTQQQVAVALDLQPHDPIEMVLVHNTASEGVTAEGELR